MQHAEYSQTLLKATSDMSDEFTHFNAAGKPYMVDVGHKSVTKRIAIAKGHIFMAKPTIEKIKANQTNKDKKTVVLYTHNKEAHYSHIQKAEAKGYDVVEMDSPLTAHLIQKLESKKLKMELKYFFLKNLTIKILKGKCLYTDRLIRN